MSRIVLFVTAVGRPDLLREQVRLCRKYLRDDHGICVVDNSDGVQKAAAMAGTCRLLQVEYLRCEHPDHEHVHALTRAYHRADELQLPYWALLDHDIFPMRETSLLALMGSGWYGFGQTHLPSGKRYPWPGLLCFSREWLAGRVPDFDGIRGPVKALDGDCGSMLNPLFTDADWGNLPETKHGYGTIRPEDEHGLQSWGYETIGSWIHFTNASHWKRVPDQVGRDQALLALLRGL